MIGKVTAIISKKKLEFTPDPSFDSYNPSVNSENKFDVEVINNSDKFASFQLELLTPGLDENSQVKWYDVEPEVCAKKPPGSKTKFQVVITKAPIPAYDSTIDLILKVFSVEDTNLYTSQKLKLRINKPLRPLRVEMPVKEFKISPDDNIEIPVLVYNLSSKFSKIILTCSGLNPDWMTEGTQRRLEIEPGDFEKTTFLCQPSRLTLSKKYEFEIEAESNTTQYPASEHGVLEILPDGVVEFSCSDKQKVIPGKEKNNSQSAIYELTFWNDSNLVHKLNVITSEKDQKVCNIKIPEPIKIPPEETKIMSLIAATKRHYIGRAKIHKFTVSSLLISPMTGEFITDVNPKPSTEVLELKVLPIIPFWAQLCGLALIPLLILIRTLLQEPEYHTAPVNSVRFFGNGSLVFSGSSDKTIRRWEVEDRFLQKKAILEDKGKIANEQEIKKPVRVIRQSPKDNDVIAVGLENGEVQLWDISTNRSKISFHINNKANRVFDIVFTKNGRDYLFSGHGNGLVKQWGIKSTFMNEKPKPIKSENFGFAISALAIDESKYNNPLLIIAGRFNKMVAWEPQTNQIIPIQYQWQNKSNFTPVMGQQNYITSLALSNNVLASTDNEGYITLLNLNKIRQCVKSSIQKQVEKEEENIPGSNDVKAKDDIAIANCNDVILEQWSNEDDKQPVRSVALTQEGDYLASTGDDGRIMLWKLNKGKGKRQTGCQQGVEIAKSSDRKFNSVDIKKLTDEKESYLLITSGDDNNDVKLYRKGIKDGTNCQ